MANVERTVVLLLSPREIRLCPSSRKVDTLDLIVTTRTSEDPKEQKASRAFCFDGGINQDNRLPPYRT